MKTLTRGAAKVKKLRETEAAAAWGRYIKGPACEEDFAEEETLLACIRTTRPVGPHLPTRTHRHRQILWVSTVTSHNRFKPLHQSPLSHTMRSHTDSNHHTHTVPTHLLLHTLHITLLDKTPCFFHYSRIDKTHFSTKPIYFPLLKDVDTVLYL